MKFLKKTCGFVARVIRIILDWIIWGQLQECPQCKEKSLHVRVLRSTIETVDRMLLAGTVSLDEVILSTCINCGCQYATSLFPEKEKQEMSAEKVLIVENDPGVRATLRDVFEGEGCAVTEASTGSEALDILAHEHDIWLVTSGLSIPGMNGLQFAREIKHRYPQQKMFLITGYTDEETIPALAYRAGYDAVAFKPLVVLELKEMLAMFRRQDSPKSAQ